MSRNEMPTPLEHEEHFTDRRVTVEDQALGKHLAWFIGDTFISCMNDTPVDQWTTIAHALRFHGLQIVETPKEEQHDPSRATT